MIIAGIDEAGYGPLLGPLVVGAAAVRVATPDAADPLAEIPDLWKRWKKAVCRGKPGRTGRLHIADSKAVYSPSIGLGPLERGLLACLTQTSHGLPADLAALLACCCRDDCEHLLRQRWYQPLPSETLPGHNEPASVAIAGNMLKLALRADADSEIVGIRLRVFDETRYNEMAGKTQNKSSVLFTLAAGLIDRLLRNFGDEPVLIVADRQGGRSHYGALLRTMFDDFELSIDEETDGRSDYRLTRGNARRRLIFLEKGESVSLPTALASMACKYARESMMRRFNAFFVGHEPTIVPTAGYWPDGVRFLSETAALREKLGITDAMLSRCR